MLSLIWIKGLAARRWGRLLGAAAGVAIAVALLGSLGTFLSASKATMTRRAIADVPVDWQVEAQPGADPAAVLDGVVAHPGVTTALEVGMAATSSFEATAGGTTQTTGPGVLLGLPDTYRETFPAELRDLAGAPTGTLVYQQTAANLHVQPGDPVTVTLPGGATSTVTVDGVVDLPKADSLFQKVGAPPGAQPQAPPDNVVIVDLARWKALTDPLVAGGIGGVRTQVHARVDHALPGDPAAAYATETGRARNLEVALAGRGLVGDNLGADLGRARGDALYAQVLFVFLGAPGALLAGLLTAQVAGAGRTRRRREQSLLRARGATTGTVLRLAATEAALVGTVGVALGLAAAAAVGRVAFGTAGFGATTGSAIGWAAASAVAGAAIAAGSIVLPAWNDLRTTTVAAGRGTALRAPAPRWQRYGVDVLALGGAAAIFWLTSRSGYKLVLAPEGVAQISVSYWAFAGPALLWVGAGLLAWRLTDLFLRHGRPLLTRMLRPLAGPLCSTVAASLSRQRRILARALVLTALTASFAASTAVFNATYRQQAEVDARLTNGADVTATEASGVVTPKDRGAQLAAIPGVRGVEPIQHRFAYVGNDLQDLYGVRTGTVAAATSLQDAYFQGGTATQLMGRLAAQDDGLLVSAETVKDFQLHPGDPITLRLQDGKTKQYTSVPFHYIGIVKEFPTAPRDSFLVANATYVARATGNPAIGASLLDTAGTSTAGVAERVRATVGPTERVTDIGTSRAIIGSSLTAVDLAGLTKVELSFALLLAAAATGLVLALGVAERRRSFAIAAALGANRRQLSAFIWAEAAVTALGGLAAGALTGWALSNMLVKVLTGVFDPPPAALAVPWPYLGAVAAASISAVVAATLVATRAARRPAIGILRDV